MKTITISFFILLVLWVRPNAQTLDDLRQLEQLKKQYEESGKLPEKTEGIKEAKSLTTFNDSLSVFPMEEQDKSVSQQMMESEISAPDSLQEFQHFGFDLFKQANIDFKPEMFGPVDDDYMVGVGDEIIITVWGEVELQHELTIDRKGQIYIPEVGLVSASGKKLSELTSQLKSIMGKSYSSLTKNKAFLDVSLGKLRAIRVFVIGDVQNPGVFTVPALTSVFTMLFYAGGLNTTGSMRNISIVRNDETFSSLDFYDFLTAGKKFPDIRLQNDDVILVPTAVTTVLFKGEVKKPAFFEMKENEGINELVRFAGGFTDQAYLDRLEIERIVNNREPKLIDLNFRKLQSDQTNFVLKDGDKITVNKINRELENYITINGPIYGPTRFEHHKGITLSEIFSQVDSIRGDAYLDRVHITRLLPDRKRQIFSINLNDFINNSGQDLLLAPGDQINIQSMSTLFPEDSVKIFGAVNNTGQYLLKKDMTLKDLIFSAGGFRKDALVSEAEISRIDPANRQTNNLATLLYVKIDSNYTKKLDQQADELFFLEPYDNIFIRANSDWEVQRNVMLNGEVQRPGIYTLKSKTERITDLISRAGGLKETAYPEGAKFLRKKNDIGRIGVDFKEIFKNPNSEENIFLQDGDEITIPEKLHSVKVIGGVNFPSSVLYEKGQGLDYYIQAAGGYIELADQKNVTIRLANGRPVLRKRFLFWKYLSHDITAGTTIYIPVLTEKESIDWSGAIRDAAAILSSVATTILIIDRIK